VITTASFDNTLI